MASTLDRLLKSFARRAGQMACCGTCLDAGGRIKEHLIDEAPRSTNDELSGTIARPRPVSGRNDGLASILAFEPTTMRRRQP